MLTLEDIRIDEIRALFDTKTLNRARVLFNEMQAWRRSGQTLTALIGDDQLYHPEISVESDSITAICDCPDSWQGPCAHIAALLLKWLDEPGAFALPDLPSISAGEYPIQVTPVAPPPTRRPDRPPFWISSTIEDRRQADDQQLGQWLHGVVLRDLRAMARQHGWKIRGNKKADVIQQIVARLADPGDVSEAVRKLDRAQRQTLYALALLSCEPGAEVDNLEQIVALWGKLERPQLIETYTRQLHGLGMALPPVIGEGLYYRSDFVPNTVARNLSPVLQDIVPTIQPSGEQQLGDPYALARAANQVVMLLEQSPSELRPPMPRPLLERSYGNLSAWDYDADELAQAQKNKQLGHYSDLALSVPPPARSLPDPTIERLLPVAGDEARLEFIYSLLVAAGIFQPGSPVTVWTEVKTQFLQRDELTQRAILTRAYFYALNWSALWEVLRRPLTAKTNPLTLKRLWSHQHIKPKHLRADLYRFRHIVLRALAFLPDGQWVALQDLLRQLRILWPRFDHMVWREYWAVKPIPSWYLAKAGSKRPLRPDNEQHWHMAQGNFVRAIISGPLHWLGLADLCFDDGALQAVRLNGLADLYWERVEAAPAPAHAAQAPAIAPQDAVQVEEHTIHVRPSLINFQAHALLDKIARLDEVLPERFTYQLAPQAVYEAFEAGATLLEILDDWEQFIPIPLPEGLRAQLVRWWEAYGRVRIYQDLTVIEFDDDYALAEMLAATSLGENLIAEISPRLVIVPQRAVTLLIAELEKAGYTPKQTERI